MCNLKSYLCWKFKGWVAWEVEGMVTGKIDDGQKNVTIYIYIGCFLLIPVPHRSEVFGWCVSFLLFQCHTGVFLPNRSFKEVTPAWLICNRSFPNRSFWRNRRWRFRNAIPNTDIFAHFKNRYWSLRMKRKMRGRGTYQYQVNGVNGVYGWRGRDTSGFHSSFRLPASGYLFRLWALGQ